MRAGSSCACFCRAFNTTAVFYVPASIACGVFVPFALPKRLWRRAIGVSMLLWVSVSALLFLAIGFIWVGMHATSATERVHRRDVFDRAISPRGWHTGQTVEPRIHTPCGIKFRQIAPPRVDGSTDAVVQSGYFRRRVDKPQPHLLI